MPKNKFEPGDKVNHKKLGEAIFTVICRDNKKTLYKCVEFTPNVNITDGEMLWYLKARNLSIA